MAINQNNGNNGDFDDDIFDGEDFNEQDFDADNFDGDDFAGDAGIDSDLVEDDFDGGDWADDEGTDVPAAKQKSLYQTGEKKGLGFNTIVIIGAVIVGGGVMMMTVMNKSAEVSAGTQNVFQSMLSMVGVMDGELSGPKEPETTEQPQETGFLSDPSLIEGSATPPQPVPMAPEETGAAINEPLTPLPEDLYAGTPRGPEEAIPESNVSETVQTTVEPALSAEDILKQAQANREKKLQNEVAAEPVSMEPAQLVEEKPAVDIADMSPQQDSAMPGGQLPVSDVAPVAAELSVSSEVLSANTKALEGVTSSLDALVQRMQRVEADITAVRETSQNQYQEMEKTISVLKDDLSELKARPIPKQMVAEKSSSSDSAAENSPDDIKPAPVLTEKAVEPVKKVVRKAKAKVVQQKPTPETSSAAWELRAAQPGRAWVSKPGQRDMQGIEVGQMLTGLGKVTAITYQNGRWSVTGTQGSIQQ